MKGAALRLLFAILILPAILLCPFVAFIWWVLFDKPCDIVGALFNFCNVPQT